MNNSKKEVRVFCDFETNTAIIRIFKFRNYVWSGGKTFEVRRDSPRLKEIASIIERFRDKKSQGLGLFKDIFWKEKTEKAVSYFVDMNIRIL